MSKETIQKKFSDLGHWTTGFEIDGEMHGGGYIAKDDLRLSQFFNYFPDQKRVLELGSMEGGHSIALAEKGYSVTAIEGRPANVKRAEFIKSIVCPKANIKFIVENLEELDPASLGKFDVVFCVGLLYHLPRPWELLKKLNSISNNMFLNTHYCLDDDFAAVGCEYEGYKGKMYKEFGISDRLSGLSQESFWPTSTELERMIVGSGWKIIDSKFMTPSFSTQSFMLAGGGKVATIVCK